MIFVLIYTIVSDLVAQAVIQWQLGLGVAVPPQREWWRGLSRGAGGARSSCVREVYTSILAITALCP